MLKIYEDKIDKLKLIFNKCKSILLVVDHWDRTFTNCKFIGISVRYIGENGLLSNLLWFKEIPDGKSITTQEIVDKCCIRFDLIDKRFYLFEEARKSGLMIKSYDIMLWIRQCSLEQNPKKKCYSKQFFESFKKLYNISFRKINRFVSKTHFVDERQTIERANQFVDDIKVYLEDNGNLFNYFCVIIISFLI